MIKVLIVDDSIVMQRLLAEILQSDKEIEIIGMVSNGVEAIEFLKSSIPDVITMDICMPKMGGLEAIRFIMERKPIPVVVITSLYSSENMEYSFEAMEAGAVAVLKKPQKLHNKEFERECKEIISTVKLMSEIKLVRRKMRSSFEKKGTMQHAAKEPVPRAQIVAIGVSTGGPPVLQTIFSTISKNFSLPILVVQHISPGFLEGLIEWLSQTSALPIHIAEDRETVEAGHIYFAPDGFHMGIDAKGKIVLSTSMPENNLRPAVSYLFRSVTHAYGKRAIGILLTGMGKDGAEELKLLREKGGITIAQDEETSVIHGMPGEAIRLNGAAYILSPIKIAETLEKI